MKQTAVEFLMNEMPLIDWKIPYWKNKLEKAKEIEEEQIMDAYRINPNNENWSNSGIDYYNETFKSE
jgi:hypothetical protein